MRDQLSHTPLPPTPQTAHWSRTSHQCFHLKSQDSSTVSNTGKTENTHTSRSADVLNWYLLTLLQPPNHYTNRTNCLKQIIFLTLPLFLTSLSTRHNCTMMHCCHEHSHINKTTTMIQVQAWIIQTLHPYKSGLLLPLADHLPNAGNWTESNYTITAIDFASRYCISRGNPPQSEDGYTTDGNPNIMIQSHLKHCM